MANRNVRQDIHAFANEYVRSQLYSGVYSRLPLLSLLAHKGGTAGALGGGESGRPSVGAIIGSMPDKADLESLRGSTQAHVRWQTGTNTAVKNLTIKGTTVSPGNDYQADVVQTALFSWSKKQAAINIPRVYADMAQGKFAVGKLVRESSDMALNDLYDDLAQELITGSPSDQSLDLWDAQAGLDDAVDSGNTYGRVDRSQSANAQWRGKEVSDATAATLDIVEDANLTQGVANKSDGIEVIFTGNALYKKFKAQANAEQQLITTTGTPDEAMIGFLKESFKYNGVIFTFDPKIAAGVVYALRPSDFCFEVHPGQNFRVSPFRDGTDDGQFGEADAMTAKITLMYRFYCKQPWNQVKYTNVS